MKLLFPIAIIVITCCLSSCNEEKTNNILTDGSWQLKEQLADPGDGSGTYQPVDSDLALKFLPNGTLLTTVPLCNDGGTGGTYDETKIYAPGCSFEFNYELIEDVLYLYPPCIEPCGMKFRRAE